MLHEVNIAGVQDRVKLRAGHPLFLISSFSVVIRTTQVIAAMGADQLALVPGQPVRTGRTDLAMMIDSPLFGGANRTTL